MNQILLRSTNEGAITFTPCFLEQFLRPKTLRMYPNSPLIAVRWTQFEESFFYHLNGAYNAIAQDFDQDGDLDIAAISFFPDYQNTPEQSFIYLENQGSNNFIPYTFPEVTRGRWIVMDTGDLDQDGDLDLILGSLAFEIVPPNHLLQQWVQEGIGFIIMENTIQ